MTTQIKRILVALDASAHSHAALESAAALAARLDAELLGLFVHDTDLLRLAALPFALEVGLTSAGRRALDLGAMERSLNAQAQKARAAFEATATRHHLHWSFRATHGRVVEELRAASSEVDLLALGTSGHMALTGRRVGSTVQGITASASCSLLIERHQRRAGSAVVLLYEDSPAADRALESAQLVARDRDLVIVLGGDARTRARLRGQLDAMRLVGARTTIVDLEDGGANLRALARRRDCGLLMLAHDSPLLAAAPELLGELEPVLLAR